MASKNHVVIAALFSVVVLAVIAIGAVYYLTNHNTSTTIIQPSGSTTIFANGTSGCSSKTNFAQTLQVTVRLINTTSSVAIPTALGSQTINVYQTSPYGPTAYQTGTTSSAGIASISGINCNTQYLVTSGNNLVQNTYFQAFNLTSTGVSANPAVNLYVYSYSAPTLKFQNSTVGAFGAVEVNHGVTTGASTAPTVGMTVKSGTNYDSYGSGLVVFIYNNSDINQPTIFGANGNPVTPVASGIYPTPATISSNTANIKYTSLGTQNSWVAYPFAACSNGAFSTPSGCTSASGGTIFPTITTKSTFTNNEIISVEWIPGTLFYSGTAAPQYGISIGPNFPAYQNQLQSSITTITTSANAIQFSLT